MHYFQHWQLRAPISPYTSPGKFPIGMHYLRVRIAFIVIATTWREKNSATRQMTHADVSYKTCTKLKHLWPTSDTTGAHAKNRFQSVRSALIIMATNSPCAASSSVLRTEEHSPSSSSAAVSSWSSPSRSPLRERQPRRIERIVKDRQRSNTMSKRTRGLLKKVRH